MTIRVAPYCRSGTATPVPAAVHLHIEELVVHGRTGLPPDELAQLVQAQLERRISAEVSGPPAASARPDMLPSKPPALVLQIAETIYGALPALTGRVDQAHRENLA